MHSNYHILVGLLQSGKKIQTGSMLYTKGSAPQVPGALAIFDKKKLLAGTLGGGLLENHAQNAAEKASENQQSILKWVHFNADMKDQAGAICGGSALFFIDANPEKHIETYSQLIDSIERRKKGVLFTLITEKKNIEIKRFWIEENSEYPETVAAILKDKQISIQKIISSRTPSWIESVKNDEKNIQEKTAVFIEPILPKSQLIIVGAGHIGQALCSISNLTDFEITVIDNREELTSTSRFPEAAQIICKPLIHAFQEISIAPETYIVIATQGHKTDIEALKCCIGSNAAYIGVIGSKRKTALMKQEFIDKKWATPDEWDFVHAPIGIDIHSKTVNEIAISIVAELIQERYETNFQKRKKTVSSIVLAAGKSTRMGKQKLLLPFNGTSIIKTIVEKIAQSNSNQTFVVTGSDKLKVKAELKSCDVVFVDNERFEEGMLSSVQAGVDAIDSETDGILVFLGDQPTISMEVINRLISAFQKTEKGLLVPTFNAKRGHPVLISSKYKNKIKLINPEIGLRELFLTNLTDILEIEVDSENILKDIDTPEDYIQAAN